jgi:hypothetical protein
MEELGLNPADLFDCELTTPKETGRLSDGGLYGYCE